MDKSPKHWHQNQSLKIRYLYFFDQLNILIDAKNRVTKLDLLQPITIKKHIVHGPYLLKQVAVGEQQEWCQKRR